MNSAKKIINNQKFASCLACALLRCIEELLHAMRYFTQCEQDFVTWRDARAFESDS